MILKSLFANKQTPVVTIAPDATIDDAVSLLGKHRIGALVVSSDKTTIEGMLSERDIVRSLANPDHTTLSMPVRELMTADVHTCTLSNTVAELMELMTSERIRHVPVIAEGLLSGMVSIGDVVNARLRELESERQQIEEYITGN